MRPSTVLPTALAVAAGAAVALQSYINGRLGRDLGSGEIAAAVNNTIGLLALIALVTVTRALPRARRAVRDGAPLKWWYLVGGLGGALLVSCAAIASPKIGVALAIAAVGISAFGARAHLDLALLAFAVIAGVGVALQQAANGQLARATGEPLVAGTINFVVGLTALLILAWVVTGFHTAHGWDAPPLEWIGGFIGATIATGSAVLVSRLGVLGLTIAITAGQVAGALVIDLVAPVQGEGVTVETVVGVVLAFFAVALTARDRT